MQPNWPAPSSGGREAFRVQSSPRVGCAWRRVAPLHSRRRGSAKHGGRRAKSTRRAGSAAVLRRRTYSRSCGALGTHRGERWHFHPCSAGRSRPGPFSPLGGRVVSLRAVPGVGVRSGGRSSTPCAVVAWLAVGCIRPVLKHGPRSATVARVVRVQKPVGCAMKVKAGRVARRGESRVRAAHRRPIRCHAVAGFE